MATATSGSTVQLVINVVDANSGEVVQRTVGNVERLGTTAIDTGKRVAEGMAQATGSVTAAGQSIEKSVAGHTQAVEKSAAAQKRAYREIGSAHAEMIARTSRATGDSSNFGAPAPPAPRPSSIVPPKQPVGEYADMLEKIGRTEQQLTAQRLGSADATVQGWKRATAAWNDYDRTINRSSNVRRTAGAEQADLVARRAVTAQRQATGSGAANTTITSAGAGFGGSGFSTGEQVAGFKKVEEAADHAGGHTLQAIDKVRLLRDQLGLPITGAMEKIISQSKLAMGAIGAIGGALAIGGSAMLLVDLVKLGYEGYQALHNVNDELKKYTAESGAAANQKLFDTASIETTNRMLGEVNSKLAANIQLQQQARVAADNSGAFAQYGRRAAFDIGSAEIVAAGGTPDGKAPVVFNAEDGARQAQLKREQETLTARGTMLLQGRELARAQAQAELENGRLVGGAQAASARDNAVRIAAIQQQQAQSNEQYQNRLTIQRRAEQLAQGMKENDPNLTQVHQIDRNAGRDDFQFAADRANAQFGVAGVVNARKEASEIGSARDAANAAGLRGEQMYAAQVQAQENAITRRIQTEGLSRAAADAEVNALRGKAHKEFAERVRQEEEQIKQAQAQGGMAGLTGLARSDAEAAERIRQIRATSADKANPDSTTAALVAAANQSSGAGQQKDIDDFNERFRQMGENRSNSSMSANQRIDADTRRTVAEITRVWNDFYDGLKPDDPRRAKGQVELDRQIAAANKSAVQQKQEDRRQLIEQTRKAEAEAARSGLPQNQQQTRAVLDDFAERTRALQALREKDSQNADLYRRQELAAEQAKHAKLLELQRAQRDQLAGQLRGIFSNPGDFLKQQGEVMASKYAANALQQLSPGLADKLAAGDGQGGLFDVPVPGEKRKRRALAEGAASIVRPTFGGGRGFRLPGDDAATTSPQQAVINAATAVINVSSASFNGAGSPSSAVRSIASGGYVSTGNGGAFNLGTSPATSAGSSEAGSPAASAPAPGVASSGGSMPGVSESASGGFDRIYGGAQSGIRQANSMGKDLGVFGKDANGNNAGMASKIPGLKNMSSESLGKLGGTAGGLMGVYSAFQGKGGWGGAAQGALGGAQVGMQYGGLAGAAIGAVVGGVLGFIGHGARVQAQKYYFKELLPKIEGEMQGFEAGTADYQSVYDDLTSSDSAAKSRTRQMGKGAIDYYSDRIHPDIVKFQQRLTREQKAGRSQFGMQAAQFHQGGLINSFGSLATSSNEGFFHGRLGEVVLNEQAAMRHGDVAMMMNSNASRSDIADYMGSGGAPQQRVAQGGGDVHLYVSAIDQRGVSQWLDENKHEIRKKLNSSYAENSGGGD